MTFLPVELVPEYFRGLPTHALVIHATVVALPLTALALLLAAFSSSLRARLGVILPLLAIVSLVLVPISTSSGGQFKNTLEARGVKNATLNRHAELADQILPWTIGVTVLAIAIYALQRTGRRLAAPRSVGAATKAPARPSTDAGALAARSPLSVVLAVLSVIAAVGLLVTVVAVGHLGAESVWQQGS